MSKETEKSSAEVVSLNRNDKHSIVSTKNLKQENEMSFFSYIDEGMSKLDITENAIPSRDLMPKFSVIEAEENEKIQEIYCIKTKGFEMVLKECVEDLESEEGEYKDLKKGSSNKVIKFYASATKPTVQPFKENRETVKTITAVDKKKLDVDERFNKKKDLQATCSNSQQDQYQTLGQGSYECYNGHFEKRDKRDILQNEKPSQVISKKWVFNNDISRSRLLFYNPIILLKDFENDKITNNQLDVGSQVKELRQIKCTDRPFSVWAKVCCGNFVIHLDCNSLTICLFHNQGVDECQNPDKVMLMKLVVTQCDPLFLRVDQYHDTNKAALIKRLNPIEPLILRIHKGDTNEAALLKLMNKCDPLIQKVHENQDTNEASFLSLLNKHDPLIQKVHEYRDTNEAALVKLMNKCDPLIQKVHENQDTNEASFLSLLNKRDPLIQKVLEYRDTNEACLLKLMNKCDPLIQKVHEYWDTNDACLLKLMNKRDPLIQKVHEYRDTNEDALVKLMNKCDPLIQKVHEYRDTNDVCLLKLMNKRDPLIQKVHEYRDTNEACLLKLMNKRDPLLQKVHEYRDTNEAALMKFINKIDPVFQRSVKMKLLS